MVIRVRQLGYVIHMNPVAGSGKRRHPGLPTSARTIGEVGQVSFTPGVVVRGSELNNITDTSTGVIDLHGLGTGDEQSRHATARIRHRTTTSDGKINVIPPNVVVIKFMNIAIKA